MLQKVNNSPAHPVSDSNHLLAVIFKAITPAAPPVESHRCRFDLFVRIRPGNVSPFRNQQRTWCYRGDKYTDQEHKMLRNLLNMVKKQLPLYDRVILYDHHKQIEEREILKIVDDRIEINALNQYSLMLLNYPLPQILKVPVNPIL